MTVRTVADSAVTDSTIATAREVRALTRDARVGRGSRRHAPEDLYIIGACVVLAIVEAVGIVSAPGHSAAVLGGRATAQWYLEASEPTGAIAGLLLAFFATLFTLARRIGPVVMTRAQVHWWLPLPVDRRGLVLPGYLTSLLVPVGVLSMCSAVVFTGAGGFVAGAASAGAASAGAASAGAASAGVTAGIVNLILTMVSVACLAALIHSAATWSQHRHAQSRWLRAFRLDNLVHSIPALVLLLMLSATAFRSTVVGATIPLLDWLTWLPTGWPILVAGGIVWPVAVLVPAALLAAGLAYRGLPSLTRFSLSRSADAGSLASEALLSMEVGGITGAPDDETGARAGSLRGTRTRPRRLPAAGPAHRFILTQFTVWRRSRGQAVAFISCALLPVALLAVPYLNLGAVLVVALVVSVLRAVTIAGSAARVMAQRPALARLYPIGDVGQRRLASILPAAVLVLWCVLCFGLMIVVGAAPVGWAWFAVPVGLGLAGAAVRSAYRPGTDWETPLISTPMGAVSSGWVMNALHGRTATIVVLYPALVAIVGGTVTPSLVLLQWAVSAAAWWWCTRLATSGSLSIPFARWIIPR